jgi:ABC-type sugar transport system ATPase subunit
MLNVGSDDLVIFTNVTKTFAMGNARFTAIRDLSLRVRRGDIVILLGPSGCGKSTLLNFAAGLVGPTQGQVIYDGRKVSGLNPSVAYMTQADHLLPWRNVGSNIAVPLEIAGIPHGELCLSVPYALIGAIVGENHRLEQGTGFSRIGCHLQIRHSRRVCRASRDRGACDAAQHCCETN